MKINYSFFSKTVLILIVLLSNYCVQAQMVFVHPGAVNGKKELDFVKNKIALGEQPWSGKFTELKRLAVASSLKIAPVTSDGQKTEAHRAYANALAWYYTGEEIYATNAINILNTWGNTFKGYEPDIVGQNQLQGGWIGALLGPAAEIMRGYSGWKSTDIDIVKAMFKAEFYPVLNVMSTWNGNVDLTQIDAMMNIAVFCEDETEFKLGVERLKSRNLDFFYLKSDNIKHDANWYSNPTKWLDGLTQESCRDNNHHSQYALASALHAAEVAYNQGVDLYTENQNRYVSSMELMAEQLLTGYMGTCSDTITTSDLYATFEVGFNHYSNRKGAFMPYTEELLLKKVRKNGQSDWNIFYETLTHNMDGTGIYAHCPRPNLGIDKTICGNANLVLDSKLNLQGKSFKWYKDGVLIDQANDSLLVISSGGTYRVTVDSTNCLLVDEIRINGSLKLYLGEDKAICTTKNILLDAGNETVSNVNYLWNTGAITKTLTIDTEGKYYVSVSATNCKTLTDTIVIGTKLVKVKADTICAAGAIKLQGLENASVNWYDVATKGTALSTGNLYYPTIQNNSVFYAEMAGDFVSSFGKTNKGTGAVWNVTTADFNAQATDKWHKATVLKAVKLKSIAVYVTSANTSVTINFMKGTAVAYTKTITGLGVGKQTLLLDFDLLPGTYVVNAIGTKGGLSFEASGGFYPYSYDGYISYTFNESWESAWAGFFYDWKIVTSNPCIRTSVNAIIDANYSNCTTGIEDENLFGFTVYPNPSNNILHIKSIVIKNGTKIQLINQLGKVVMEKEYSSLNDEYLIDVHSLPIGIYYIKIGNWSNKVLINR